MKEKNFINPVNQVSKYFEVLVADTNALEKLGYQFRYEIFCKEFQYEKEVDCPHQLEKDIYDDEACHCFILNKQTKQILGSIRLLMPSINQPDLKLPFEHFTDLSQLPNKPLSQIKYGEASRLAVHQDFRRRQFDGQNAAGTNAQLLINKGYIPDRNYPLVALTMMLSGAILGRLNELDYLFAMMEPKLNMVLGHYGIVFTQVGNVTNYHGERAPFVIDPLSLWQTLNPDLKPLLNYLDDILGKKEIQQQIA